MARKGILDVITPEQAAIVLKQLTATAPELRRSLKGIYRFEKESDSEFKAWAVHAPGEYFASTYREWRQGSTSQQDVAEVRRFVKGLCPGIAALCK